MADKIIESSTKERLKDIEKELSELKKQEADLKERWISEKNRVQQIRDLKAEIEDLKLQAENFEREGNLEKVAEIRYGKILQKEKELLKANEDLNNKHDHGLLIKEEVDAGDIAEIVSKWTGIPVSRMMESERTKLVQMEKRMHSRLIGQNEAVTAIANAIRRSRSGLQDINRPIGSFVFIGTTGVGKTETARALAQFLFDDENAMIRIDMSEYMEKYSVSRLLGAPPGYIGYEEGGQLTEAVRRRPYAVILLDEIEKAHPEVFNVLLQVLDDGRLTDGKGRTVNFRNTIIIMTSNLGTDIIQDKISEMNEQNRDELMSALRSRIIELLRSKMRPEFLNRIDEIVLFKPLTRDEIQEIAGLQIENFKEKLYKNKIELEITPDAIDWLTRLGYDQQYGARPLKRAVQRYIADPLALKLLEGEFNPGDVIIIDANDSGKFIFSKKE